MKIGNKEKLILSTIAIALVGVGYYYIGYKPQSEKINSKKIEFEALLERREQMQQTIEASELNQHDITVLDDNIESKSKKLYPDIWQPKLVKELSDLAKKANLNISFKYEEEKIAPISNYYEVKENTKSEASTLEGIINQYNSKVDNEKKIDYKNNNENSQNNEKQKDEEINNSEIIVKQMQVTGKFNGKYSDLIKFVKAIEDHKYLVAVPNITITPSGTDEVSGSLLLEFYSVPKLDGDSKDYYEWKSEGKNGKDNPFADSYKEIESIEIQEAEEVSLDITLKQYNEDTTSLTIERPEDDNGKTKLSNNSNSISDVTVEFTEEDGEYFVKYKIGTKVYPNTGNGIQFVPKKNINIFVESETRKDDEDNVGIKLNVKNSTNKRVDIEIVGDDKENPRINIATDGNVHYTNK
ncbi:MAG: hypothetical protein ACRC57_15175 [Sarcina sp.]